MESASSTVILVMGFCSCTLLFSACKPRPTPHTNHPTHQSPTPRPTHPPRKTHTFQPRLTLLGPDCRHIKKIFPQNKLRPSICLLFAPLKPPPPAPLLFDLFPYFLSVCVQERERQRGRESAREQARDGGGRGGKRGREGEGERGRARARENEPQRLTNAAWETS